MLILGGGAAAFVALGYLGLQFIDDDEEVVVNGNKPELVFASKGVFDAVDAREKENINLKVKEKETMVEEVKNEIDSKKLYNDVEKESVEKEATGWGQWWRNEYSTAKGETSEVQVSDYN